MFSVVGILFVVIGLVSLIAGINVQYSRTAFETDLPRAIASRVRAAH
jgi:hypothetical protein